MKVREHFTIMEKAPTWGYAFNQEKALVEAFSVITNLRMDHFQALVPSIPSSPPPCLQVHSLHIVAALLLTTLLHGAAVMAAFCLARWVWLCAFKYPA